MSHATLDKWRSIHDPSKERAAALTALPQIAQPGDGRALGKPWWGMMGGSWALEELPDGLHSLRNTIDIYWLNIELQYINLKPTVLGVIRAPGMLYAVRRTFLWLEKGDLDSLEL